jgi:hypothetical protein
MMNRCSACSTEQRRSPSEWRIRSGVSMFFAYVDGEALEPRLGRVVRELAEVALERPEDVARARRGEEVVHCTLRARSLEAVRVPDDPRRHVAAVRPAEHARPIRVEEVEALERRVERRHQVLVVDRPPTQGRRRAGPRIAVPQSSL